MAKKNESLPSKNALRVGVDNLAKGLVTDVFSKEAGQGDVGFHELENLEPTSNGKLMSTSPFVFNKNVDCVLPDLLVGAVLFDDAETQNFVHVYQNPDGAYLLTDAWEFNGATKNQIYEFSAFDRASQSYSRRRERIYYLNDIPLTLPLATFATTTRENLVPSAFQRFRAGNGDGEIIYRHYFPNYTSYKDGERLLFIETTLSEPPQINRTDSVTYNLSKDYRFALPSDSEFEAFRQLCFGAVGAMSYGYLREDDGNKRFVSRVVPAIITRVEQGEQSGVPYIDFHVQSARRNAPNQHQFPSDVFDNITFTAFQVFHSQYGYKVWHGNKQSGEIEVVLQDEDLEFALTSGGTFSDDYLAFVHKLSAPYTQVPLFNGSGEVATGAPVRALPSALTPLRTGGDAGSNYVGRRLYIDVAPQMVIFESTPKDAYTTTRWIRYDAGSNTKNDTSNTFVATFGSSEISAGTTIDESSIDVNTSPALPAGSTIDSRVVVLPNRDSYVEVKITIPNAAAIAYTVTLEFETSLPGTVTENFTMVVPAASDTGAGSFLPTFVFPSASQAWGRIEAETPDTSEAASVEFQALPYTAASLDSTPANVPKVFIVVTSNVTVEEYSITFIELTPSVTRQIRTGSFELLLDNTQTGNLLPASTPEIRLDGSNSSIASAVKTKLESVFGSPITVDVSVFKTFEITSLESTSQNVIDPSTGNIIGVRFTERRTTQEKLVVGINFTVAPPIGSVLAYSNPPYTWHPLLGDISPYQTAQGATYRSQIASAAQQNPADVYWHSGLSDVNAFYTVAVTAVYDGVEESDVIGSFSQEGQFDYDLTTQTFESFFIEGRLRLNLAAIGRRITHFKVYAGKTPQQSVVTSEGANQEEVVIAGNFKKRQTNFDRRILNALDFVGVIIVDKDFEKQFDRGVTVFESAAAANIRASRYVYAPKQAGLPIIFAGIEFESDLYSWIGGNFDSEQVSGGGLRFVNAFYPNERDMTPFIDGGWASLAISNFEPFWVTVRFRITGGLFNRGVVQYRRQTGDYRSFVLPNGATNISIRTTEAIAAPTNVNDRLEYEAVPTGLGSVINPNGTLSQNLGRLSKSAEAIAFERDGLSAGFDLTVAGRRYLFMMQAERGQADIRNSMVVRSATSFGIPKFSFLESDFFDGLNVYQYETQVAGRIVSAIRNRFNDFSENLRVLLVQEKQCKILSVQGDNPPISIQELDGIGSPFMRAAVQTPYGVAMISPQGLFLINDNNVELLSRPIDTLWKQAFNDTTISTTGDYPLASTAASVPVLVQPIYDVEQKRLMVLRNTKAFVYDFEKKVWFKMTLTGNIEDSPFNIVPARVIRETNESFIAPCVNFGGSGTVPIFKRDLRFQLVPATSEFEVTSVATTNVIVAPEESEFQILRVSVVLSGALFGTLINRRCRLEVIEAALGLNGNFSIDGGLVTNTYLFNINDDSRQDREFDVPVNVGKNVRAFGIRVTLENVRMVIEEINATVAVRRRAISRGINPRVDVAITPPTVVTPAVVTGEPPFSPLQVVPLSFNIRLSNPLLPAIYTETVVYDVFFYEDTARTQLAGRVLGRTKAQIIDADTPSTLLTDALNNPVTLQKGRIYYGIARTRLGGAQRDTLFSIATALDVPEFVAPSPTDGGTVIYDVSTLWQWSTSANATGYDFEYQFGLMTPIVIPKIGFLNTEQALSNLDIDNAALRVRVRARNSVVVSDWVERNYLIRERNFDIVIDGAGESSVNPLQVLQGNSANLKIDIIRPEGGIEFIELTNANPSLLPNVLFSTPDGTQGSTLTRAVEVGVLPINTYTPEIVGETPRNTVPNVNRQYFITVRDIFDEFGSNLNMWFRAEDIVGTNNNPFSIWNAFNRASDSDWRWFQGTAANQWRWRDGTDGPISGRPSVYHQATTAENRHYALQNLSGSAKSWTTSGTPSAGTVFLVLWREGAISGDTAQGSVIFYESGQNTIAGGRTLQIGFGSTFLVSGFDMANSSLSAPPNTPLLYSFRMTMAASPPTIVNTTTPATPFSVIGRRNNEVEQVLINSGQADNNTRSQQWVVNRFGSDNTSLPNQRVFRGHIYEMIFFNRELTFAESNRVNRYLNAKYNLGLSF